jgi:hypothetical protein
MYTCSIVLRREAGKGSRASEENRGYNPSSNRNVTCACVGKKKKMQFL